MCRPPVSPAAAYFFPGNGIFYFSVFPGMFSFNALKFYLFPVRR